MVKYYKIRIFFVKFQWKLVMGSGQCSQMIFLENPDFYGKKSLKSRGKKPKIAEKSRVFTPKNLEK